MKRILVIRGGAIGDFILTLPAIKLLRDRFPQSHLEILGYKHIIAVAEKRFYANATRSIEYAPLATFFARDAALSQELMNYFGSFDLVVSYLFDPDEIFETNLKRGGIENLIRGPAKLGSHEHAAKQLARPLEKLGLHLQDPAATIYPSETDRKFAREFLGDSSHNVVALHPSSGSETKNWALENWRKLGEHLFSRDYNVIVVTGEADEERAASLAAEWKQKPVRFAKEFSLPHLAALLDNATFIGHDSGISHIAAAAGARCILLFGPTDPAIWAPANKNVTVLRARGGNLRLLHADKVIEMMDR